jgi:hypothetical protein
MFGLGFTVIVKVLAGPVQLTPPATIVAFTVMVAVIADVVGLYAVKLGRLPIPLAPRPMNVLLFVQVNVAPATLLPKVTAAVADPLHTVWLATALTVAVGFTVIVNEVDPPPQALALVVTVIVPDIGVLPALVAVKLGILPVPLAARPIAVLEFVHEYVVPTGAPENVTACVAEPAHTVWFATPLTNGVGFTV